MAIFKRKKPAEEAAKGLVKGHPIEVYNSPTRMRRKGTAARNVNRIKRLEYAIEKLEKKGMKDSPHYESLKLEHTRRVLHFEQDRLADEGRV